jgi:tetratricopeptide (TPR) repeat protein
MKRWRDWALVTVTGLVFLHGLALAARMLPAAGTASAQDGSLARYRAGIAAFKEGRLSDALTDFQQVSSGSSDYLRLCATNMVGQINRLEGQSSEARAAFVSVAQQARAILQANTDGNSVVRNAAVLERLALHYQAEIFEQQQDWSSAIAAYEQLLAADSNKDGLSPLGPNDSQAVLDRLGRLYWRMGRYEQARQMFDQFLSRWPDDTRAPLIRLALVSLENTSSAAGEQRLAFLFFPLIQAAQGSTGEVGPTSVWPVSMPALPELPNPARDGVDRLLKDLPSGNMWRPILLLEKGWMCFEADRSDESIAAFAEAARLSSDAKTAWAPVVRNYAELSKSISLLRRREFAESLELAQAVLGRNPQGQIQMLASSIVSMLGRRLQQTKVGTQCDVNTLE